ncbi:MAG TPA: alpha/beta hydrolase-fold protein [bacterium]|nr:alpha/beta hydrolase-fold protein [bacterium]
MTNERPSSYSLPHTEVRTLRSLETGVNYVLYISLPAQYNQTTREYPVLFLLDADYSFAIAHNVVEHFTQRNNLAGIILAGIAYRGKSQDMEIYRKNRVRDYTPSHVDSGVYSDEISAYSGGGQAFLRFINNELIPYLAGHFRIADERGIVGHSLGGYFATYTLIHSPATFNRYIIVSPSLWYDDHMIFRTDYSELTSFTESEITVFFGVGSHENQPGRGWPMVDDMLRMADELRDLDHDNLEVHAEVFPDEIHNSIFPAAFTRGVRIVYD